MTEPDPTDRTTGTEPGDQPFREVTERREAEETLRAGESIYRLIFETAPSLILSVTCQGIVLDCNIRIEQVLGYTRNEAIGASIDALFYPDHLVRVQACLNEVCRQGSSSHHEFRMIRKDGRAIEVAIGSAAIRGQAGECLQATCIIEDITERKHAERALLEQRNQLRTIFATVPDILVLKDAHGIYRAVNPVFCEFLGRPEHEILGKTDFDLFPASEAELYRRGDREVLATGRMLTGDETVAGLAGPRMMHVAKTAVVDGEGRAAGILVSLRDVTDRRRAERELAEAKLAAEAASRAKSDFLANISHEIRTPMTAILGYTDLLMTSNPTPRESRDHLQTIYRSGKALLELVNDILDISRIEAGRITVEKTDCSPREIVDDLVTLMQVRATDRGLELRAHYAPTLPATIRTDPVRLRQILTNLVGNAIKFTDRGSVEIAVLCVRPAGMTPQIQFAVCDTGVGMSRAQIDRLFEPLAQVDAAFERRFGGTGLGLAISKGLAVKLGGDIQVQSSPGVGSIFTLSIDLEPPEPVTPVSTATGEAAQTGRGPADAGPTCRGRVLLAEDIEDVRNLVRYYLARAGLEVDLAENGQTACRKAAASAAEGRPYDLVLMDIQMPELDGYEATRRLRAAGWRAPIVALTASAMSGDAAKCVEAGCDGHIAKPIDPTEIVNLVARYVHPEKLADEPASHRESRVGGRREPLESSLADHPVIGPLLEQFVEELPGRAEAIARHLQNNDVATLAEAAHQLKGAAGIYGFASISDKANVISRQVIESRDSREIRASVLELIDLCSRASCRKRGPSAGGKVGCVRDAPQ